MVEKKIKYPWNSNARLQGGKWGWYRKNHKLRILCVSKSNAGNYRADMADENNRWVYHWLSPTEVQNLFNNYEYLSTHEIINSDLVYDPVSDVNKRLKRCVEANLKPITRSRTANSLMRKLFKSGWLTKKRSKLVINETVEYPLNKQQTLFLNEFYGGEK